MFDTLDDTNFDLYAAKYYDNPSNAGEREFEDDLSKIRYLKRLFSRYEERNELNERLILNHLIILYNVFEVHACTRMLAFRLRDYLQYLKPFLVYLSYWPEYIKPIGIQAETIDCDAVALDEFIIKKLRKL